MGSNYAEDGYPNGARNRAEVWRLGNGEDIEHALRAAERLLAQAEERRRHEQNVRIGVQTTIAFVALSLASSIFAFVQVIAWNHDFPEIAGAFIAVLVTSVIFVGLLRALQRQRRRISLDYAHRIATQLSAMINESLVDVAERERWSYLRLQATKLRLSAFPLSDPSGERYGA